MSRASFEISSHRCFCPFFRSNHAPRVVGLVFLGLTMVFEIWTVLSILRRQPLIHIKDASPSALSLEPDREVKSRRSPFDRPLTFRVLIYGVWLAGGFGMLVWICLSSTSIPSVLRSLPLFLFFFCSRLESTDASEPSFPSSTESCINPRQGSVRAWYSPRNE